ncbi:hypothetical protein TRFO_10566 [Tritrichomonas foetus]|uniref:Uncharacterized protein n=1 Tax=Tritrichomonas foetus TaxID=1144522 RepID=A0A1J4JB06_9EUKA|nr:hypothetical protein TRFO_10566 [Tritrichomonas foetus]|eukprot:OHS95415.1 hypothetical protein TRFO_10566 [Tritrichomonas foetus]
MGRRSNKQHILKSITVSIDNIIVKIPVNNDELIENKKFVRDALRSVSMEINKNKFPKTLNFIPSNQANSQEQPFDAQQFAFVNNNGINSFACQNVKPGFPFPILAHQQHSDFTNSQNTDTTNLCQSDSLNNFPNLPQNLFPNPTSNQKENQLNTHDEFNPSEFNLSIHDEKPKISLNNRNILNESNAAHSKKHIRGRAIEADKFQDILSDWNRLWGDGKAQETKEEISIYDYTPLIIDFHKISQYV